MTKTELELVARVIYRIKTGRNMPDRRPLDQGEEVALEHQKQWALEALEEQAKPIGLTVQVEE
jgi:hypothetical protein